MKIEFGEGDLAGPSQLIRGFGPDGLEQVGLRLYLAKNDNHPEGETHDLTFWVKPEQSGRLAEDFLRAGNILKSYFYGHIGREKSRG